MDGTLPVFDFDNPWVALIQIALFYVLPRLTGKLVDASSDPKLKITVLAVATVLTSGLTWLLDVAIAQSWSTVDWGDLGEILVNSLITFLAANVVYGRVLKPVGTAAKDQASTTIQLFDRGLTADKKAA